MIKTHTLSYPNQKKRTIRVYTPPCYHPLKQPLPVLYMHDGQHLFDEVTGGENSWSIDRILDQQAFPLIVVGIDNGPARFSEYSPWTSEKLHNLLMQIKEDETWGGQGASYINFITQQLIPFIDGLYNSSGESYLGGSSMGGLISLYGLLSQQKIFSGAIVMSPAFWFAPQAIQNFIQEQRIENTKLRIYMDMGTNETSNDQIASFPQIYLKEAEKIHKQLAQLPLQHSYKVFNGAVHHEAEWSKRFYSAIRWLTSDSK